VAVNPSPKNIKEDRFLSRGFLAKIIQEMPVKRKR
jgi:hypothetical protein